MMTHRLFLSGVFREGLSRFTLGFGWWCVPSPQDLICGTAQNRRVGFGFSKFGVDLGTLGEATRLIIILCAHRLFGSRQFFAGLLQVRRRKISSFGLGGGAYVEIGLRDLLGWRLCCAARSETDRSESRQAAK